MRQPIILVLILLFVQCSGIKKKQGQEPIARVFDKYLYPSDLRDIVPSNISQADSVIVVRDFMDKWIKQQLLLYKAEIRYPGES